MSETSLSDKKTHIDMQIKIEIKSGREAEASVKELYGLLRAAFQQWQDANLLNWGYDAPIEWFQNYVKDRMVIVAHNEETGELLGMRTLTLYPKGGKAGESNLSVLPKAKRQGIGTRLFEAETEWLLKAGYRYVTCSTAVSAPWSVRWHLKNGYHIVGYSRSEKHNYASYVFRKQIATDVCHHPADLLWTRPIAPVTAKIRYAASYIVTCICKTREGRLNWIGRLAKKIMKR